MAKTTTTRKSIVILGGSWGGVSLSHYLLHHVVPYLHKAEPSSYEVVLISSSSQAFCRPAAPRAFISDDLFKQEKLFVDIEPQFKQYPSGSFRFLHATATNVDTQARVVTISSHGTNKISTVSFHALVIATGASTPSPLLGFTPGQDVPHLRSNWAAVRAALPTARRVVIAGGGPTGVEVAGELGEHLNGPMARAWFLLPSAQTKPRVEITLVAATERILPGLRKTLAERAEVYLAALGVKIISGVKVTGVTLSGAGEGKVYGGTVVTLSNGETIKADVYIPCVGTTPNTEFVADKALLAPDGKVETNPKTLRVDKAGEGAKIYALGDASNFAVNPGVHNTLSAVPILAANMKRDLAGMKDGEDRVFEEDLRETQLVPIGKSKGVGAMKGWWLPSFLVWLIKGRDYWLWTTGDIWSGKAWAKEQ
ncbi:putative AMID-like mitochondrial oxidoreductase [Cercophora newfieldiana]|uniref:AMID-like mitochondrial oxidoreductase n=1 Tax=Cercophora newfieldiana TaxID=92897 RepID=A0AA40CP90_9PEZI|nr:putative AMID-like mitochondrial oxidoreductase [Cercophora newfieldiana]